MILGLFFLGWNATSGLRLGYFSRVFAAKEHSWEQMTGVGQKSPTLLKL